MKTEKCKERCVHSGTGLCYCTDPTTCVQFLPHEGTNFVEINGVVELPPHIDEDKFSQYFMNWIESMGWLFGGGFRPCD